MVRNAADRPAAGDSGRSRGRLLILAGFGISLVTLGAVIIWALKQPAPKLPSGGGAIASLIGAMALYICGLTLRGERWRRLVGQTGTEISHADAVGLTFVGYMGNTVIPARGGDAMRVYLGMTRTSAGARTLIGTIFAEKILDSALLLSLLAVVVLVFLRGVDVPIAGNSWLLLAGAVVLAAAAAAVLYLLRDRPRVRQVLRFIEPMSVATRELRGAFAVEMVGLSVVVWAIEAVTYVITAHVVGLDMSPVQALYVVSIASAFALIPSGPGYAGTFDAGVIFGVHAIGGSSSLAISYLVTLRFVLLVPITVVGLVILVSRYGGWSRARHAREATGA